MREWIKTDDMQWRRNIDQITFDLVEVREYPNGYNVVSGTIDLSDYDENDVLHIINSYGYKNIKEMQKIYKSETNGVIAECLFEQSYEVNTIEFGVFETEDEAANFAEEYVSKQRKENDRQDEEQKESEG